MLIEINAVCPACGEDGPIRVSSGAGQGSVTTCRECGAHITALTLEDGHVALQAGEATSMAFLHETPDQTRQGGEFTVVLPPQKFGLRNADYGETPQYAGIDDAEFEALGVATTSPDLLFRPDGTRRPEHDLIAVLGDRGMWAAQLSHEIDKRIAGPPPMAFPPKIFLSYRWQTEAMDAWVADLGSELRARGYDVFLDRELPQTDKPNVPEIVSRVAECRYFLAVVDPGYLARIGGGEDDRIEDGWVYDEFRTAAFLAHAGLVRLIGFWRDGPLPGDLFRLAEPGQQGNLIDVREADRLSAILDQVFPPIDVVAGATNGAAARAALLRSHEAFVRGDTATALSEARRVAELVPGSPDGFLQIIRTVHRTGDHALGLQAAEAALEVHPHSIEVLLDAAAFAAAVGDPQTSAAHAANVLDQDVETPKDLAEAHAHMASALDDMGRIDAALGHARSAARLDPDRATNVINLGYILRRAGERVAAVETFSEGLKRFSDDLRLLENYAAAACEAGLLDPAEKLIMLLHQRGGADDTVGAMARAVMNARKTGEDIVLVELAALPPPETVLQCDTCAARILLATGQGFICAVCGTPRSDPTASCVMCLHRGSLPVVADSAGVQAQCPFCSDGAVGVASNQ